MAQGRPQYAYFQGRIVPLEEAKVSVMTHALHYGTGVFGGLRGYWNNDDQQLYIFRPQDHFKRFLQSAALLRMDLGMTADDLTNVLTELLRAENLHENVYIRPLAYKSDELIGVRVHNLHDAVTIFAMPFGSYMEDETGVHVGFSAWRRIDDNMIPARGKITGAYANSALIKTDAMLAGFDEGLTLNADGHISEVSGANVFLVRDGVALTPPVNANVLEGITRRTIITLLQDELGIEVRERDIDRTEMYICDEAFLCGTAVQIAAITRADHRTVGTGDMGPITKRLREVFFAMVQGRLPKYHSWLAPVYAKEPVSS